MLRVGLLLLVALASQLSRGQTSTLITPQKQIPTSWQVDATLPSGTAIKLRYELEATGTFIDGPRVIVPCNGPSEEANLRGWRDDSLEPVQLSPDATLRSSIKWEYKVGGDSARHGRDIIRREQTKIEMALTQLYSVRPGEGEGPRPNEQVFRYRYQKMFLILKVGSSTFIHRLSAYYVPIANPVLESTRPCGDIPKETAVSWGHIGTSGAAGASDVHLPGVHRGASGYVGAVLSPEIAGLLDKSGYSATGVDINSVTISDPNFKDVPELRWMFLPTGTVLVPDKGGIQSMITVEPLLLTDSQFQALCSGMLGAKSIAVHCLEIEKQQPDPSVKFSLARASDPGLRNLAAFTQRSAVKGPWDQARVWIYTDKASLEKINKRLAIGCPPGMYVRSLWEVHTMAGLDAKDLANPEIFKPELLGAVCNKKEAVGWLSWVLAENHGPALIQYLGGGGKELTDLLTSTNPLAASHFLKVMGQLLQHPSPEIRLAFLKFLDAQDIALLKKAIGKPVPTWERHLEEEGEEGELGKKLKEKFGA